MENPMRESNWFASRILMLLCNLRQKRCTISQNKKSWVVSLLIQFVSALASLYTRLASTPSTSNMLFAGNLIHSWPDQNYFTDRDLELKTYPDHQYL
jgi:hypothetical protein